MDNRSSLVPRYIDYQYILTGPAIYYTRAVSETIYIGSKTLLGGVNQGFILHKL